MIRKGRKLFYTKIINNKKSIDEFKSNYKDSMLKSNSDKYYFFSNKYFNGFNTDLFEYSFIFNVFDFKNNMCLGSAIILICGNYGHYHLSGKSKYNLDNSLNNYMLDEAIKFTKKKGCHFFHLGGGRTNDKKDSLYNFKNNFSKSTNEFWLGKDIINQKIYNLVCKKWENKSIKDSYKYKNYILKYRYI